MKFLIACKSTRGMMKLVCMFARRCGISCWLRSRVLGSLFSLPNAQSPYYCPSYCCVHTSPPALKSGCLLVQELISGDRHAKAIVVNHGGIEVLMKVLDRHLDSTNNLGEAVEIICSLLWMIVADNTDHLRLLRRVDCGKRIFQQVLLSNEKSNAIKVRSMLNAMESLPLVRPVLTSHLHVADRPLPDIF